MDVRDAAERLAKDEGRSAERLILDETESVSTIATLLAKQGRELGELRARHRARRARLEAEIEGTKGVFFQTFRGDANDAFRAVYDQKLDPQPVGSPLRYLAWNNRNNGVSSPSVTPSWGAFRTPAADRRVETTKRGTATTAFLNTSGMAVQDDESLPQGIAPNSPAIPPFDLDRSVRDLAFEMNNYMTLDVPHDDVNPWSTPIVPPREAFTSVASTTNSRSKQTSPWSEFGSRRSWLRRPENARTRPELSQASSRNNSVAVLHSESEPQNKNASVEMKPRAALLSIPRLAIPTANDKISECEDWRAPSSKPPVDAEPPTDTDDWRSLSLLRARDPATRAAAAFAYGEYKDVLSPSTTQKKLQGFSTVNDFKSISQYETDENDKNWVRRPVGPIGRNTVDKLSDSHLAETTTDELVWTKQGTQFANLTTNSVGRTRQERSGINVDTSTSFAHESLRPMDDENMRSDDSNLHKSIGTGAFGRKPTGDFFETRNETVLKHGAKLPSRKADQTHIKIQM